MQGALRKADESGLLQAGKNLLLGQGGAGTGTGTGTGTGEFTPPPPPAPEPKKMKPALKWGLIIGGLAVVGTIVYMVLKKKPSSNGAYLGTQIRGLLVCI